MNDLSFGVLEDLIVEEVIQAFLLILVRQVRGQNSHSPRPAFSGCRHNGNRNIQ
ncbi:hypothetical protein D3C71_1854590 [compost metagenome]